jgi:hypothetical protein
MFRLRAFSQNAKSARGAPPQGSAAQTVSDALHAYRSENGQRGARIAEGYHLEGWKGFARRAPCEIPLRRLR